MIIPTEIGLRICNDSGDEQLCTFVAHLPFLTIPNIGHKIIIKPDEQFGITVCNICHFVPTSASDVANLLVMTIPIQIKEYDTMLRILDWFKALYKVENVCSNEPTRLYYRFYRNLIGVLGLARDPCPKIGYNPSEIKVFAESCRSVILAELQLSDEELVVTIPTYNRVIEELHRMILEYKYDHPDGVSMLDIVKKFESFINPGRTVQWNASIQKCISSAQFVFKKLTTVELPRNN